MEPRHSSQRASLTPSQKHAASAFARAATKRTAFHSFHVFSTHPNAICYTNPPKLDAEFMRPETAPASLPPISTAEAQAAASIKSPAPAASAIRIAAAVRLPDETPVASSSAETISAAKANPRRPTLRQKRRASPSEANPPIQLAPKPNRNGSPAS